MPHAAHIRCSAGNNHRRAPVLSGQDLQARAGNSRDGRVDEAMYGHRQQHLQASDLFSGDHTDEMAALPSLPHLWTDPPPVRSTLPLARTGSMEENAATLSGQLLGGQAGTLHELATYAALFTAAGADIDVSGAGVQLHAASSSTSHRSPSSLSSNSEHLGTHNRFSVASTAATSEGCHSGPRHLHTIASKHASLTGVMEGATKQAEDAQGGAPAIPHEAESDAGEDVMLESASPDHVHPPPINAQSMPHASPALPAHAAPSAAQGEPLKGSSLEALPPPDYDGIRRELGLSSANSVRSTCTAAATRHTPAHKRSFLSNVLSRSSSTSSGSRDAILPRFRTTSFPVETRPPGLPSSGLANSPHRSTSSLQQPQHHRQPTHLATSSSSPSLYAMVTPASPPTHAEVDSSSNQAPISTAIESTSHLESTRRSTSSLGPLAPLPNDSVFSTATRAYIDEPTSPRYERQPSSSSSPLDQQTEVNRTPSSRASRYLTRHFASPSSTGAPNAATSSTSDGRPGDAQDNLRRSPTPSRFFGGGSAGVRSSSMPTLLSSLSNDSSSSLPDSRNNGNKHSKAPSAKPQSLDTFGLALNQLSPQMSISRAGQPLCGAVLDGKYLLIGTSIGLDFLPLHREGNKLVKTGFLNGVSSSLSERFYSSQNANEAASSSSKIRDDHTSSSNDKYKSAKSASTIHPPSSSSGKVRKPITLIKKTRFKQLVILSERSNVLLAIAGRNDHVRVYALDTLRRLIEKEMKEIDASMSLSASSNRSTKLGISGNRKAQSLVPSLPRDVKAKGRALSTDETLNTARQTQPQTRSYTMQRQYSPPPAYDLPHTSVTPPASASCSTSSVVADSVRNVSGGSESLPPIVTEGAHNPRNRSGTVGSRVSPVSSQFASASPSSTHRGPSHSPREHIVSSPRSAMRRAKSRDTLRRPSAVPSCSTAATSTSTSSSSKPLPQSIMSRRGSSATVTPDSGHHQAGSIGRRRASVATIVPTSPSVSAFDNIDRFSTISRRGSTAQLADIGQVTSVQHAPRLRTTSSGLEDDEGEESFEWVDAPEIGEIERLDRPQNTTNVGSVVSPHPSVQQGYIPAVPPLPEKYAMASNTASGSRDRAASNMSDASRASSRMTPRSARVSREREELDTEDREPEQAGLQSVKRPSSGHVTERERPSLVKERRLSLAEILREMEPDNGIPAISTDPTQATLKTPVPSTSQMPYSRTSPSTPATPASARRASTGPTSQFRARSARAETSYNLADIADFLNESAPPSSPPAVSSRNATRPTVPRLRRTMTSNIVPEMRQLKVQQNSATTSLLNGSISPHAHTFAPGASTPKLVAREATVAKRDQAEAEARDSFMSFLREGPPNNPSVVRTSMAMAESAIPASRPAQGKKLQKGQCRSSVSLRSNSSSRSAPAPAAPVRSTSTSATLQTGSTLRQSYSTQVREDSAARARTRSVGATPNRGESSILRSDEIVPVPVSVTASVMTASSPDKTRKRQSMRPRSPTNRYFIPEVDPLDPGKSAPNASTQRTVRALSLQEMLASGGLEGHSDAIHTPTSLSAEGAAGIVQSETSSANIAVGPDRAGPSTSRIKRNRWSLLTAIRSSSIDSDVVRPEHAAEAASERPSVEIGSSSTSVQGMSAIAPERPVLVSGMTVDNGQASTLKPSPFPRLLEDERSPFGNLTSDLQQRIASGATDPDGTTIMFTQQTSQTTASGDVTNVSSAMNGPPSSAVPAGIRGSSGLRKDSTSGNLDYVKLARTKGSRFLRASETGKRTYLAVLCGEQGERIELFTGAKNVSLSLNRTFVLPETPRTIEFQLQGEELLDLYLIYDSAIFALEPSTVRVREVGIQRHERRQARRERERLLRQAGTLEGVDASAPSTSPPSPATLLPPTRVGSGVTSPSEGPLLGEPVTGPLEGTPEAIQPVASSASRALRLNADHRLAVNDNVIDVISRPGSPREPPSGSIPSIDNAAERTSSLRHHPPIENTTSTVSAGTFDEGTETPLSNTSLLPYTTFQQLEYLPQIPPSVLASSYIIPPTYETVLSASPNSETNHGMFINSQFNAASSSMSNISNPALSVGPSSQHSRSSPESSCTPTASCPTIFTSPSTLLTPNWRSPICEAQQQHSAHVSPLLSPVSLLANPSARNTGPPGLFFVSRGRKCTGIVDADGRSVVRKPVSWLAEGEDSVDMPEQYEGLNHFSRIEILLTSGDKTRVCLAAFGPMSVRAIELGHPTQEYSIEVTPYEALKRQQKSLASAAGLRAAGRDVPDELVYVRDVAYLAKEGQCAFFAERVGSNVAIYSLGARDYTFS